MLFRHGLAGEHPVRKKGEYQVPVRIHPEVTTEVKVSVAAEE